MCTEDEGFDKTMAAQRLKNLNTVGVTVQLVKDPARGPECWEAVFPPPALKNDHVVFRDKF